MVGRSFFFATARDMRAGRLGTRARARARITFTRAEWVLHGARTRGERGKWRSEEKCSGIDINLVRVRRGRDGSDGGSARESGAREFYFTKRRTS